MKTLTVSLSIGADMSELHFYWEVRMGNKIELVAFISSRIVLGCVLLGVKHNLDNLLISCNTWICKSNINQFIKTFWQIESYSTTKKNNEMFLSKIEQQAIEILHKTVKKKKSNCNSVGLL